MRSKPQWVILFLSFFSFFLIIYGCADDSDPTNASGERFGTEEIAANDRYIVFSGSTWSNVTFPHLEHSEREDDDCFICHDHGASIGDSKWDCSACHTADDPENLCDEDTNHGCIMAQCDFCHNQRGGSAPAVDCTGEDSDINCCIDCHIGGETVSTGIFLDSAVEGATYDTLTMSGTTDSEGTFVYQEGEIVTFSIADLVLGRAVGAPVMTIIDVVEGALDASDPTVTNISRLLITLDQDGNADNGITLNAETLDAIKGRSIDLDQSTHDFGTDQVIQSLLNTLNSAGVFTSNTPRVLCSAEDAQSHMNVTLFSLNSKPVVTFPGALSVSGSSGCNASGCHYNLASVNGTYQIDDANYSGGIFNGKPIYKQENGNHWIHWNLAGLFGEWQLSDEKERPECKHHYSRNEIGGTNIHSPLGSWPSGCYTHEGRQIFAKVAPIGGISGRLLIGEELSGSYYYYDDHDEEKGTTFQWYRCDDIYGTNDVPIAGANSAAYIISSQDNGKYIRFGVTPGSASGSSPGMEIKSGPAGPIIVNIAPYASNVTIGGSANVGAELTGYYKYNDSSGDEESGTVLSWCRYDDQSGSNEVLLCEGSSGNCLRYTLVDDDQDKYIKFIVTPGAATGPSPGMPAESSFFGPIGFNPGNSVPVATVYSGVLVEGCLGNRGGGDPTYPTYINGLGASGVDGVYQIADTARYTVDAVTDDPCNPRFCANGYIFDYETINGTLNGKVAYKHEDYYDHNAAYWIAWHNGGGCRTLWWIADSAGYRSRGGGAVANSLQTVNGDNYIPPLEDWGDTCGNGLELSLYGGPNNIPGITGEPVVGKILTGDYDYYDADGDAEGQSTFRWLRSNTVNGVYQPIPSANGITYRLTASDLGMFIKFEVTPVAVSGDLTGNATTSDFPGIGPVISP